MVVPDEWVQKARPEEGREELLGVHQDAVPLGHHSLYVDLNLPAHHTVHLSLEVTTFHNDNTLTEEPGSCQDHKHWQFTG